MVSIHSTWELGTITALNFFFGYGLRIVKFGVETPLIHTSWKRRTMSKFCTIKLMNWSSSWPWFCLVLFLYWDRWVVPKCFGSRCFWFYISNASFKLFDLIRVHRPCAMHSTYYTHKHMNDELRHIFGLYFLGLALFWTSITESSMCTQSCVDTPNPSFLIPRSFSIDEIMWLRSLWDTESGIAFMTPSCLSSNYQPMISCKVHVLNVATCCMWPPSLGFRLNLQYT